MRIYQTLGYTTKDRAYCEPKHSRKTKTLSESNEALKEKMLKRCSADPSCAMFYGEYIDGLVQYYLCNHGATVKDSWHHPATLYIKSNRIIIFAKFINYKI